MAASAKKVAVPSGKGQFLWAVGLKGQCSDPQTKVSFAWKGNDGVYRFETLPLEAIRVAPEENVVTPYVRFCWTSIGKGPDGSIHYAVIHINPIDWPQDIQMPIGGVKP